MSINQRVSDLAAHLGRQHKDDTDQINSVLTRMDQTEQVAADAAATAEAVDGKATTALAAALSANEASEQALFTANEIDGKATAALIAAQQAEQVAAAAAGAVDGKVGNDDARLSNARDWTAARVTQAEAEAGSANTDRKWTALRVRQAATAAISEAGAVTYGEQAPTPAQRKQARTNVGLQDVGLSTQIGPASTDLNVVGLDSGFYQTVAATTGTFPPNTTNKGGIHMVMRRNADHAMHTFYRYQGNTVYTRWELNGNFTGWLRVVNESDVAGGFESVQSLLAFTQVLTVGSTIAVSSGHSYVVVESFATDFDLQTAGGSRLIVIPSAGGFDIRAFGALGDGITNDSVAAQRWLNRVVGNNSAGFVAPGRYLLNAQLTFVSAVARSFSIHGAGEGASQFIVPASNTAGAIQINVNTRGSMARFADFTITKRGTGGRGLWFEEVQGGNQHIITAAARNITIRGENRTNEYFDTFMALRGGYQTAVDNVTIAGPFLDSTANNYLPTSMSYRAAVGLDLDGAYGPNINNVMIQNVATAIRSHTIRAPILAAVASGGQTLITTTLDGARMFLTGQQVVVNDASNTAYNGPVTLTRVVGNNTQVLINKPFVGTFTGFVFHAQEPESFYLSQPVFNMVDIGVDFRRFNGREPNFWCVDGHINYRSAGIQIQGSTGITIRGMSIYNEDSAGVKPGTAVDILLRDATDYIITDNHFDFVLTHPRRVHVFVDTQGQPHVGNSGDHGMIAHNSFRSGGLYGVFCTGGTRNITMGINTIIGTYTGAVYSDPGGNNRVLL